MSVGDRLALEKRWAPPHANRLIAARERHRQSYYTRSSDDKLGDVSIISAHNNHIIPVISDMVRPMNPRMVSPLIRRMGETTIDRKRGYGSESLWAGTPVESAPYVGDPEVRDVSDLLLDWDRVGFNWNKLTHKLEAYLTRGNKTWVIKLGLKKIQSIFNKVHRAEYGGKIGPYREATLDGFFKKLGRSLKKLGKGIGKAIASPITTPYKLIKNPKKFIKDTGRKIKNTVKDVGKVAVKVASSPVFAGIMTAVSAIPPIGTAIGGAGLAAFAAAKALKPAFNVANKAIAAGESLANKKKRGKAEALLKGAKIGLDTMPSPAKNLFAGALRSIPFDAKLNGPFRIGCC